MLKQRPCLSVGLREVADVLTQTVAARDETKAQHFRETRKQALKDYEDDIKYHGKPFPIAFENESTMMDREDGVDRCPHCHWEVNSDVCENCGRHVDLGGTEYNAEAYYVDDDEDDDEDYGLEADEYEEDGFVVGDDEDDTSFNHAADISFNPDVRFVEADISEGDDDEYYSDEQAYDVMVDDSMLQEEDDDDDDIEISNAPPQQHRRRPPQRIVLSDSEDEGLIPRRRTSSHVSISEDDAGPSQEITHDEDDNDDDDDDAMLLTALHAHRRPTKRRPQRVHDTDEDENNDTSSTD